MSCAGLLAAVAIDDATDGLGPEARLAAAAGLMVLATGLLLLEIMVVSWGLLTVSAAAAAFAACAIAWKVSPVAGWVFVALVPVAAVMVVRVGLRMLQASRLVPKDEITAEAGYHHVADHAGIVPGARGELVTDALPTGRARFAGGEIDVQIEGAGLPRGAAVIVLRIDGPVAMVSAAPVQTQGSA